MSDITTEPIPAVVVPGKCLGKLPPRYDPRTLRMASYIEKRKLPKVPKVHNLSRKTLKAFNGDLGMMKNNTLGCCTIAGLSHAEQTWSTYGGKPRRPTDKEIVEAYNRINGGADEGAFMIDALKMARQEGVGGNTIYAFVAVHPLDHDQVRTALFLFGGLYIGMGLPFSAQAQNKAGKVWEVGEGPAYAAGSWGGHTVNVCDFDAKGLTVVTWGELQRMTWAFWDRYVDEVFAILEEDMIGDDRRSPQGFSLKKLAADLKGL
jgi:hypothetical protein